MSKRYFFVFSLIAVMLMLCGCSDFEYEVHEDYAEIIKYNGKSEEVVVPSDIDGIKVTKIYPGAFIRNKSIKSVVLPDGIEYIGNSAFSGCSKLISISLPNSLTFIGAYCFSDCKMLEYINIPDKVESIGKYGFCRCYNIKSVRLPETLSYLGGSVFSDCISLEAVQINAEIAIPERAFYNCFGLKRVLISERVLSIGNEAFYNCTQLSELELSDNLQNEEIDTFLENGFYEAYEAENESYISAYSLKQE